jgi:Clp amino terminal domain, pathogenicity island component
MEVDAHPQKLVRQALTLEDPELALAAVARLRRHLATLERIHVRNAREAGCSWSRVAALVGLSKQALHKKHAAWLQERPLELARPPAAGAQVVVTGEARRIVRYAREEARARGHYPVGTVHLLLGLLRDPRSAAARALTACSVTLAAARTELDRLLEALPRPGPTPGRLPVSRAARRALEQSLHESVRLGDGHLGVEHVLLGLLRQEAAPITRTLAAAGTSPAAVEAALMEALGRKIKHGGTSDRVRNLVP